MAIGDKIKAFRELRGFSVEQLADKMAIGKAGIYKWEKGETTPSIESLTEISKALDCQISDLISDLIIEKPTHEDIEPAIKGKPSKVSDAIRTVVEEGTEYYVIPKIIFQKKYILVAEEHFDRDNAAFSRVLGMLEHELQKKDSLPKTEGSENAK